MKAIWIERHGGPEVLQVSEAGPAARTGEALIAVKACGINHLNIWVEGGTAVPLPLVMGTDAAGVVLRLRTAADEGRRRAVAFPARGAACARLRARRGRALASRSTGRGGTAGWRSAWRCRPGIPSRRSSTSSRQRSPVSYHRLAADRPGSAPSRRDRPDPGAGAASTAAIRSAFLGADRATSSTAAKLEHARRQGAEVVVNYRTEDVAARVKEATGGRGIGRGGPRRGHLGGRPRLSRQGQPLRLLRRTTGQGQGEHRRSFTSEPVAPRLHAGDADLREVLGLMARTASARSSTARTASTSRMPIAAWRRASR
jgi:hypothetical protein